jgi:hypothetical protein
LTRNPIIGPLNGAWYQCVCTRDPVCSHGWTLCARCEGCGANLIYSVGNSAIARAVRLAVAFTNLPSRPVHFLRLRIIISSLRAARRTYHNHLDEVSPALIWPSA